ncbi:hypothetical protein TWF281_001605 [Arthrobotrys megalospora]
MYYTNSEDNDVEMVLNMAGGSDEALGTTDDSLDDDSDSISVLRETLPPSIDLKLYSLISKFMQYQGTFAFSSTYAAVPNPGLRIKGLGESCLRLPVSTEDAAKLFGLGSTSPFGKGEETIIDPTVRSSRQLDPSQLEFENPGFSDWLQGQVLGEISTALGIDTEMRPMLNLYKLLIYEKGDHFKTHRDTPKEDGMIGTVVVVLPSMFEGGVIKLSHAGEKKSFDFAPDCKYNFGVAAWYSDVEHAVDELLGGYRLALVYNLTVEGAALSADKTAVKPELLEILRELKAQAEPVAYALENKYSLAQRRLGFKGQDRYIISNLIAGINKVGGISMSCGDIQVKLSEDEDEMDDIDDDSDEDVEPPNLNRARGMNGYVEITLASIEHVAGTYRHFETGQMHWNRKLYTLGASLDEMESINQEEEYTGNEGTLIHTWYKTSCIILWPTSEATSIVQQVKEPLLAWESVLKIVTTKPPSLDTQEEKDALGFTKLCALIERCICFPPPDDQIRRAGEMVSNMLRRLPNEFAQKTSDSIFDSSNLVAPWKPTIGSETIPNPSQSGLLRVLRLKSLFPKDLPFSFDPTVQKILGLRTVTLEPIVLLKLVEIYQESPRRKIVELLRSAFKAHPNVNLLQELYEEMEKNTSEDSPVRKLLNEIPRYDLHEFIIAGLKERFLLLPPESREDKMYQSDQSALGAYFLPMGYSRSKDIIIIEREPSKNRITQYLQLLDEQPEPHRSHLIQLFTEAITIPLDKLVATSQDDTQKWRQYLNVNNQVVETFVRTPSLAALPCAPVIRENMVEAIIKYFPPEKPESPCYYLPAWTSPRCPTGTGCEICGPINQFLQSNTEHHYHVHLSEEHVDHYTNLELELSSYPTSQVTRVYEYRTELKLRYTVMYASPNSTFTIQKLAEERYRKAKRLYDTNLQIRKNMLKAVDEPFNQFGKTQREVGESFVPLIEGEEEAASNADEVVLGPGGIENDSDWSDDEDLEEEINQLNQAAGLMF